MKKYNYSHPEWIKRRKKILERDNFTCRCCKREMHYDEIKLHVHHTSYNPKLELWEYPNDRLITLCDDCHNNTHSSLDLIKDLLDKFQIYHIESIDKVPAVINKLIREIEGGHAQ